MDVGLLFDPLPQVYICKIVILPPPLRGRIEVGGNRGARVWGGGLKFARQQGIWIAASKLCFSSQRREIPFPAPRSLFFKNLRSIIELNHLITQSLNNFIKSPSPLKPLSLSNNLPTFQPSKSRLPIRACHYDFGVFVVHVFFIPTPFEFFLLIKNILVGI